MNIVIVGGGKIGYYLAKTLLPNKHRVTLIEAQKELCEKIANELNINVINGDGTDIESLSEAETQKADTFIALTGKDENNLIACQLAKSNFGVRRTISRVNNPKNIMVFERLGVDIPLSSTSIIADLIEQEVDYSGVRVIMKLKNDRIILSEIVITADSPVCNKSLRDLDIPEKCMLVSVIRDEDVIIPNGLTVLRDGDYIIVASSQENHAELKEFFLG